MNLEDIKTIGLILALGTCLILVLTMISVEKRLGLITDILSAEDRRIEALEQKWGLMTGEAHDKKFFPKPSVKNSKKRRIKT